MRRRKAISDFSFVDAFKNAECVCAVHILSDADGSVHIVEMSWVRSGFAVKDFRISTLILPNMEPVEAIWSSPSYDLAPLSIC